MFIVYNMCCKNSKVNYYHTTYLSVVILHTKFINVYLFGIKAIIFHPHFWVDLAHIVSAVIYKIVYQNVINLFVIQIYYQLTLIEHTNMCKILKT